jgi:hypothetical protein
MRADGRSIALRTIVAPVASLSLLAACASRPSPDSTPEAAAEPTKERAGIVMALCRADAIRDCERMCKEGSVLSCARWAQMLRAGLSRLSFDYADGDDRIPAAPTVARQLYLDACARNYGEACNTAAEMLVDGEGGDADAETAATLFERACNTQSARACTHVGRVAKDVGQTARALELLDRACDLGDPTGCDLLADLRSELERKGGDVTQDPPLRRGGLDRRSGIACPGGAALFRTLSVAYGYFAAPRPQRYCARIAPPHTRHGPFAEWASLEDEAASSGVISARGEYRDGQRVGAWDERDMLGAVRSSGKYVNGEKAGRWIENDRGAEQSITYLEGRPHGPYERVDQATGERETGAYTDGKKSGAWTLVRRDGTTEVHTWIDGREAPPD